MNSPFTQEKQFPFSTESAYYAGVITLPAKKLFKNIEYQNLEQKEQMNILLSIAKHSVCSETNLWHIPKGIKYYSFEYHPQRNKSKPCLHMNLMYEFNGHPELIKWEEVIQDKFMTNIENITKSTMIRKICHCSLIKTEIDAYNWVNYIFKDYPEHFIQHNDYIEDLLENHHIRRYADKQKAIPNDLDYK